MNINDIIPNKDNPRVIRDDNFKKLVQSIKDFPEMLEIRPIVLNKEHVILGGNMRYRACKEAGLKDIPVQIVDLSEDKQREFIIKDNVSGGDWDWDVLANEWDADLLDEWGLDFPHENESEETNEIDLLDKKVIEVNFVSDEDMQILFDELIERGYECKILTL